MKKTLLLLPYSISAIFLLLYMQQAGFAQVVINEAGNRNAGQIADEEGKYEDWIELYNAGADTAYLLDYGISDDTDNPLKWTFPDIAIAPDNFLMLFASGKNRKPNTSVDHWEAITNDNTNYKYRVPDASTSLEWKNTDFILDAGWSSGKASIGYGDSDDSSLVATSTISVYARYTFDIADTSKIGDAKLFVDYDDGFVAYLNGVMIAQSGFPAGTPAYNAFSGIDHEAIMYQGYNPDEFYLDFTFIKSLLVEGTNALAVEVHNSTAFSSDLTIKPFLFFGITDTETYFETTPAWFNPAASSSTLHTNFKIATDGESIVLANPEGVIIDSVFVICQQINHAYGRETDGATTFAVFTNATPGTSNNSSTPYWGYMEPPSFSATGGFYDDPINVGITCPDADAEIYYTTNGETPDDAETFYTDSVSVSETGVLKAVCFDAAGNYLQSKPATQTYFIDEAVSLPVISITTDNENLYGPNGIYDNWWTDWKKPCYIEYFDTAQVKAFAQNAAIKIDGGAGGSRSLPQKSFRVEPFNDSYGDGVLNYPLIPRKWFVDNYETFYLRNGSNFWNVMPYKDAFMVRTLEGTHNDHMAYTPILVFLNGEYWGLYELREKLDAGRYKQANNISKDSIDLLSMSYWYGLVLRTLNGSDTGWYNMRDFIYNYPTPDDTLFYDLADSKLDLKNFADYMIAESWLGNYDWPWNNIKMWRDRGGDKKWRYAVVDVEWGIGYGWSNASSDLISYIMGYNDYTAPFLTLMQNQQFYEYFINRYADLMNSTFLPDRTLAMEDSIFSQVMPEMGRQLDKWGNGSPILEQIATFLDYRNALRSDFEVRTGYVRQHMFDYYNLVDQNLITLKMEPVNGGRIQLNTLTIYESDWLGVYWEAVPITFTAVPNTGFTFSHWLDHPLIDDELNPVQTLTLNYNTTFTAVFTGTAMPEQIVIGEINYNSEASVNAGDWIELYNAGEAAVNISGWKLQDADPMHTFIIPDGTILNPDGRLVIAENTTLFTTENPDVTNYIGPLGFGLSASTDFIKLFNEQNTPKLILQYFDSLPWPKGADGQGRTLELNDPDADLNNPYNWFDGCIGGSPGVAYTLCNDPLVISEINYNSGDSINGGDWIELWNVSDSEINIGNWVFMDDSIGAEHTFILPTSRILAPNERWVLAQDGSLFNETFEEVMNYDGSFIFNLDGGGEWLRMYDTTGRLQISVRYNDDAPWPAEADGAGYTLELIDINGVMNNGSNWTTICIGGSPGTAPSEPCVLEDTVIVSNEIQIANGFNVYPNPVNNVLAITTHFTKNTTTKIELFNPVGLQLKEFYNSEIPSGEQTLFCNFENISAGIYLLVITIDNVRYTESVVKM